MSAASRMTTTLVAKWLSIDERRLVNWKGRGVLPALNFVNTNGVHYFDRPLPFLLSLVNIIKEGDNDNC